MLDRQIGLISFQLYRMIRKLLAFILLQSYLSVAFGVSLVHVSCCDDFTASEALSCHISDPIEAESGADNCALCLITHHPDHNEDCCPDCEEVVVSVQEDGFATEPLINNHSKLDLKNMQVAVILLPWLLNFAQDAHLQTVQPEAGSPLLDRAAPVPLFIRNCVYRT